MPYTNDTKQSVDVFTYNDATKTYSSASTRYDGVDSNDVYSNDTKNS